MIELWRSLNLQSLEVWSQGRACLHRSQAGMLPQNEGRMNTISTRVVRVVLGGTVDANDSSVSMPLRPSISMTWSRLLVIAFKLCRSGSDCWSMVRQKGRWMRPAKPLVALKWVRIPAQSHARPLLIEHLSKIALL